MNKGPYFLRTSSKYKSTEILKYLMWINRTLALGMMGWFREVTFSNIFHLDMNFTEEI
jgi:hypothetical protein